MYFPPAFNRPVHRWVAPTLKEIRKRNKKHALPDSNRSEYLDWNYRAEVYACGKRLQENFNNDLLHRAFVHRAHVSAEVDRQKELGIYDENQKVFDNTELVKRGDKLISKCTRDFLIASLPKMPEQGINAVAAYLSSDDLLANLCTNLGMEDLILCPESLRTKYTLSDTFKAVVGALAESTADDQATSFIKDIVCTQLNQKDLTECWNIEEPIEMLKDVCKSLKIGEPEPRLIGEMGRNTVLAAYHVAFYTNKKLIGTGVGENIENAKDIAARNCLTQLFGINQPFHYKSKPNLV